MKSCFVPSSPHQLSFASPIESWSSTLKEAVNVDAEFCPITSFCSVRAILDRCRDDHSDMRELAAERLVKDFTPFVLVCGVELPITYS